MDAGRRLPIAALLNLPRHLSFARLALRDLLGVSVRAREDAPHLEAAMDWLCRAHDAAAGEGVSGGYSWRDGWWPAYPETTGYIIPTFLDYAEQTGQAAYRERAVRMADWELRIQLPEGGVRGGMGLSDEPVVFNTGQVIQGWAAMARAGLGSQYLDAAVRAVEWLIRVQDAEGKWSQHEYRNVPHAYHTRVAWPILEIAALTGEPRHRQAAERHVNWVLRLANGAGWFEHMSFGPGEQPFTHTIAYTLRGLLECAALLDGPIAEQARAAVRRACEAVLMLYERAKHDPRGWPAFLPGRLNAQWRSSDHWSCVTGDAQMATVFVRLFELEGDARFLNAACKLIDQAKATQPMRAMNAAVRGAVPGSYPIWGAYMRFGFPNWAAKFLVDAMLLAQRAISRLESEPPGGAPRSPADAGA